MDKQEVIEKLRNERDISRVNKENYANKNFYESEAQYCRGAELAFTRSLILVHKLNKPEKPEKEELPDYIIKELKNVLMKNEDLILYHFHEEYFNRKHGNEYSISDEALDWFDIPGNTTRIINAIRNGYKPYKKPMWVVKFNNPTIEHWDYFTAFRGNDENHWVNINESKPNYIGNPITYAHKFTNKDKAEAVATLIDGTVEEWSE